MKRFTLFVAAAVIGLLAACTGTIPTQTFNDKAGLTVESVTTVRKATTALLVAGKITVEQDKLVQAQLDLVVTGVKLAKSLEASDPVNAAAQLTSAIAQFDALKKQTGATP